MKGKQRKQPGKIVLIFYFLSIPKESPARLFHVIFFDQILLVILSLELDLKV